MQFASLYFGAIRAALSAQDAAGCRQALFSVRNNSAIARIQFAMADMNTHINHGLPLALVATFQATGTAPQHGSTQYGDYMAVNPTIDSLIKAWDNAELLWRLRDFPPLAAGFRDTLDGLTTVASKALLVPVPRL